VIMSTKWGKDRLKFVLKRVATAKERAKAAKSS
jgi:hypothetical protein